MILLPKKSGYSSGEILVEFFQFCFRIFQMQIVKRMILSNLLGFFIFGFSFISTIYAQNDFKVPDSIIVFSREDVASPPLSEEELKKFIKTISEYSKKMDDLEPQLKKDGLDKMPTASSLLSDLQKGKPTPLPIPQKIQDFYKKYTTARLSTADSMLLQGTLASLLLTEVTPQLRFFPKALLPWLKSKGWADPKDFVRVQYQTLVTIGAIMGFKEWENLPKEMDMKKKEMEASLRASSHSREGNEMMNDLMKDLQMDPNLLAACKAIVESNINPETANLVKKYQPELDKELRLSMEGK